MQLTLFAYPILSLALIGGGVALIAHASDAIRRLLAARVDLIARPADGRLSGAPKLRALVKTSAAETSLRNMASGLATPWRRFFTTTSARWSLVTPLSAIRRWARSAK